MIPRRIPKRTIIYAVTSQWGKFNSSRYKIVHPHMIAPFLMIKFQSITIEQSNTIPQFIQISLYPIEWLLHLIYHIITYIYIYIYIYMYIIIYVISINIVLSHGISTIFHSASNPAPPRGQWEKTAWSTRLARQWLRKASVSARRPGRKDGRCPPLNRS